MTVFKRRILTTFFILLFLVLAPVIVFYANGNILGRGWNILATGGIFIKSMESGSELYVNGKIKDTTTFFTRDYFLKNLKPGAYSILVKKEGYNDWANKINVYANRVTESNVFMLPIEVGVLEIKEFLEETKILGTTTSKIFKPNSDYEMVKNFFSDSLILERYISIISTTTGRTVKYAPGIKENPIESGRLAIWMEGKDIFMSWNGRIDSSPRIFCDEAGNEIKCQNQLKIYSFDSEIKNIDFFPNKSDVVIITVGPNIYAIEAEKNIEKKPQLIFSGQKPDFKVFNNIIYIKDGDFFGQVELD